MWRSTSRSRGVSWSSSGSTSARARARRRRRRGRSRRAAARTRRRRRARARSRRRARRPRSSWSRSRARRRGSSAITSSGASDTDSARNRCAGRVARDPADDLDPAAAGHVDVEQDDVGLGARGSRRRRPRRWPRRRRTSTRPSSSARTPARKRSWSSTITTLGVRGHRGVPSPARPRCRGPGASRIAARPPCRSMRPTMESRTPRRSAGTASGSNPGPRSRTNTCEPLAVDLDVDDTGPRRRRTWRR